MTTTLLKNAKLAFLFTFLSCGSLFAQLVLDTIAYQDFEVTPAAPVWNYTGVPSDFQSGNASPTACIPNTPLGINSSRAWHVMQVSGGNPLTFDNTLINPGYDSIRVNFKLAGLNLAGATGGPDNLDYVLVEYSLDNGASWVGRLRIRGSLANNCFWAYDATGVAAVQHLPASETVFQATTSGLQVAEGYSFCEISFPGNISQLMVRITPRSSSASDSWLVDNLVLTGEVQCAPSSNSITEIICDSYTAPSGAIHTSSAIFDDTIPNTLGCDSIITIDLTVNSSSSSSITETALDVYTAPSGATFTTSGIYEDTISNAAGCDSIITIDLTMNYTGIDELNTSNISIYPNPVKDNMTIKGLSDNSDIQSIRILDLNGSEIKYLDPNENVVNVSSLSSGMYFIEIVHRQGEERIKFLKE